jgi:hypothetical protein
MSESARLAETDHLVRKDSLVKKEYIKNKENPMKPDGFKQFWEAYPKKKNKAQAQRAFKAQKINGELPDIIAHIKKQCESTDWRKERGQFIPYPSTYLNNRKWEEIEETTDSEPF